MDASSTATLARIWADATPLARFIEEKAAQQLRESTPARRPTRARQLSTLELVARSMQFDTKMASARDKARTATINDLIAGRFIGLGRPSDSYAFERVDDSFWIGAAVDWIDGATSRDGRTVIEIRVVPADALKPIRPEASETVGRLSKKDAIRAAIAAYAKEDPTLDRKRLHRFQAYRSHLTSHGYNPRKDGGFSEKNFEKYETEFRTANKHLFPT